MGKHTAKESQQRASHMHTTAEIRRAAAVPFPQGFQEPNSSSGYSEDFKVSLHIIKGPEMLSMTGTE
jgi:hypothetical protein